MRDAGGTALALGWDLADLAAIPTNLARIAETLGPVDILVNITGGPPPTLVAGQDAAAWKKHFDAMVLSVIAITDAVLPGMRDREWGRIVASTSVGRRHAHPQSRPLQRIAHDAARLVQRPWPARSAATASPPTSSSRPRGDGAHRFLDEQKAKREGKTAAEIAAASTASIPVGRYGDPQEYADTVAFLASTAPPTSPAPSSASMAG